MASFELLHNKLALRSRKWRLILWYWLPAILCLAMVAQFSGQGGGGWLSRFLLSEFLQLLRFKLATGTFEALHTILRKTAHVVVYATLGLLWFRAIRATVTTENVWRWRWSLLALVVCFVVSAADELNQAFTPGRSGSWRDVMLDLTAAILLQLFVYWWMRSHQRSNDSLARSPQ